LPPVEFVPIESTDDTYVPVSDTDTTWI
jgi:hypothetical protein